MSSEVVRACACCGVRVTKLTWDRMARRGYQDLGDPDVVLELRACECGTTRSREVPRSLLSGTRRRVSRPEPVGLHSRHRPAVYDAIRILCESISDDDSPDWLLAVELESLFRLALSCRYESGPDSGTALGTLRLAMDQARGTQWQRLTTALYRVATRQTIRRSRPGDAPS